MADWQEWVTTCFVSAIFAYMVAKLFSVVVSFRKENLRVELGHTPPSPQVPEKSDSAPPHSLFDNAPQEQQSEGSSTSSAAQGDVLADRIAPIIQERSVMPPEVPTAVEELQESSVSDEGAMKDEDDSLLSDSEEWEGIEGTDLRRAFRTATSFFEQLVMNPGFKVSNDIKLQFYGLYKQATEGPCSSPQPSAYRPADRAKWHAWKKLGDISPEDGMQRYITLLSELCPDWNKNTKEMEVLETKQGQSVGSSTKTLRMGPVFSMPTQEMSEHEGLEDIHICAKEGDINGLEKLLQNIPIDQLDSDGRTALHWAVDQGHLDIVKLLVSCGAEINAKDVDGQTALHYAATCQWEEISAFLLKHGADPSSTDNEGCTPYGQLDQHSGGIVEAK